MDLNGTLYKKPCTLVICQNESYPTFGKLLDDIYIVNSEVFFEVLMYITTEFCHHYHSYKIKLTNNKCVVSHKELFSFHPHHVRVIPGCAPYCVVPKHHFIIT